MANFKKRLRIPVWLPLAFLALSSCPNPVEAPVRYALSVSCDSVEGGSVAVTPEQADYEAGSTATLTATAASGWVFGGWSGDLAGDANPASIVMDADKTVVAAFVRMTYALTVATTGEGTVTQALVSDARDLFPEGATIRLTALPAGGWVFDHWEGDLTGSTNPAELLVDAAKSVVAVFVPIMHGVEVAVFGHGTVTQVLVRGGRDAFAEGSTVRLTAVPDANWMFAYWKGGLSGAANPAEILIGGETLITAVFERNIVVFADANLEAVVRTRIEKPAGTIYASEVDTISNINANGLGIVDISGIEGLVGLTSLTLSGNSIADIGVLSELGGLRSLYLSINAITDFTPLAGLHNIEWLGIYENSISSLSFCAGMTKLIYLDAHACGLSELGTWERMPKLMGIDLYDNDLVDIQALAGAANLEYCYLQNNNIEDISALAGMRALNELDLSGNQISDIGPIAGMVALYYLYLDNNDMSSLIPLTSQVFGFSILSLSGNQISDITPLVEMADASPPTLGAWSTVDLRGNPLSETSLTVSIPDLESHGVTVIH